MPLNDFVLIPGLMLRRVIVCCGMAAAVAGLGAAHGQALTTASRIGDVQIGGGFSLANSDYETNKLKGGTFYADYDFKPHWGVEVDFHQVNDSTTQLYERTYEVGGRYLLRPRGALTPYVRAMYGRGVLNYPQSVANLAYNMLVGGGGVDVRVKPWLNVRGDFEYQNWFSGPGIQNGLTPMVGTVGVAFHLGSNKLNGLQWAIAGPRAEKPLNGKGAPKQAPPPPPLAAN